MKRFKHILYVYEDSAPQQAAALGRAATLAGNNQAQLTIIDVVEEIRAGATTLPGGPSSAELTAALQTERRREIETLAAAHGRGLDIDIRVHTGPRFLEVIRTVLRDGYDLVIKAAENPDWVDRLFGSDDMHLLRKCPCPVFLLHPEAHDECRRILAAVDFDPDGDDADQRALNEEILRLAGSLALAELAELRLVHAWDAPEAGLVGLWADDHEGAEAAYVQGQRMRHYDGMEHIKRQLEQLLGDDAYEYLSPRVHLPQGAAKQVLPALAREIDADVVVMGTVARTGIPGLFIGNTAEAILDQLQCSVLAIKPPGFRSPVAAD